MPIFLVTPLAKNFASLKSEIAKVMPEENWQALQNSAGFLIKFNGTTIELSNLIGITDSDKSKQSRTGSAMVTLIGSYYGRGPSDMGEWLKTRFEG